MDELTKYTNEVLADLWVKTYELSRKISSEIIQSYAEKYGTSITSNESREIISRFAIEINKIIDQAAKHIQQDIDEASKNFKDDLLYTIQYQLSHEMNSHYDAVVEKHFNMACEDRKIEQAKEEDTIYQRLKKEKYNLMFMKG
jgi:viroplasmin and RNaseH domain-containing protein